jgi:[DsrC]-trisulfide reductase subunit J
VVDPRIIGGLVLAGAVGTSPAWVGLARGKGEPPRLQLPQGQCVEPVSFMRARHMELLDQWRNKVVREGERVYVASDGRSHTMSLTGTCLGCHGDAGEFCNRCHQYAGVEAPCWDCHRQKRSTP